jgi:hypothetical protein
MLGTGVIGGAAFPEVVGELASHSNSFTTSHSIPYPGGTTQAGERLLALLRLDKATISSGLSGWTDVTDSGTLYVVFKVADGSEGGTLDLTLSSSRVHASIIYRLRGVVGTPEAQSGDGSGTAPNPPSLTVPWGIKKTLWIAAVGQIRILGSPQPAISGFPAGFTNGLADKAYPGSGSSVAVGAARLFDESTDTIDPGAFTANASAASGTAVTIGIRGRG